MIVVTVSLWPGGDERLARVLGHADIFNDGSQMDDAGGLGEVGDYEYRLVERKSTVSRSKLRKRTGRVIGFRSGHIQRRVADGRCRRAGRSGRLRVPPSGAEVHSEPEQAA